MGPFGKKTMYQQGLMGTPMGKFGGYGGTNQQFGTVNEGIGMQRSMMPHMPGRGGDTLPVSPTQVGGQQGLMRPSAYQNTGVSPGHFSGPNAVQAGRGYTGPPGGSVEAIQAEMARRQVGAQLGPRNAALAGYQMGR